MNSIPLTKLHKSKLLEMCKTLFPEYKHIWFNECYENIVFEEGTFKQDKSVNIHWFEFVMIHLVERLSNKIQYWEDIPPYVANIYSEATGKWNLYTKFHFHYPKACYGGSIAPNNPIDYLYKEFQKLKQ